MMKKILYLTLLLIIISLAGCNYPGYEVTPMEGDSMATEIARILTGTPVQILLSPTPPLPDNGAQPPDATSPAPTNPPDVSAATATEAATATLMPTPTPPDSDPSLALGTPDWVDSMDNGDNWPTGVNQYTTIAFKDGYLKLTAETDLDGWRLSWPFLGNFYLEAKMQTPDCSGSDHYGLMFRVPENANANKGYLFGITCDGRYSLRRWDGKTMFSPITWTESAAINKGENTQNSLGVMAKGANLTLYINGQKVSEISDNSFLQGSFGIFVGGDNQDKLTVWVDQIRYWENP